MHDAIRCSFGVVRRFGLLIVVLLAAAAAAPAVAQTPYPVPRLATVTPPGAKAGTTVEVTLTGADLDEVQSLYVSDAKIKAERLPDPPPPKDKKKTPPPAPLRFKVTVPADVPLGIHDVRAVGKWGVSNPRAFVVGGLGEVAEKETNNDVHQAQPVALGSVIHGAVNPKPDVDYFRFAGKKDQRVVVHAAAWSIDSKLNPLVQVFGPDERELASNRNYRNRDAVLDCVLPADGDYLIRVCEFTYLNAGPDYFYRLTVATAPWIDAAYPPVVEAGKPNTITLFGRNLPGGKPSAVGLVESGPLDELAMTLNVPASLGEGQLHVQGTYWPRRGVMDGFEHRLTGPAGPSNPVFLARVQRPVVLDNDKNDTPETAQPVPAPCELCGRIEKSGDRDWYTFTAKKGDVWVLEAFADRLGAPVDLLFQVRQKGKEQPLGIFDDHPDVPAAIGRLFLGTSDPKTRLVVPEDGAYQIMVRTHGSDLRSGARHIYRLSLRREEPDFRLFLLGNNDVSTGGPTVRRGGSQDLDIVCYRQDGFDGEVTVSVEGLPGGVVCPPQILGPKQKRTALVVTAAANAPIATVPLKVTGVATINGAKVVREARATTVVWPAPNNVPPLSRLARSTCLAVRDKGPFALETAVKNELAAPVGGNATVKVQLRALAGDFKTQVQIDAISGPAQSNGQPLNIPKLTLQPGKTEGDVKINLPSNALAGTYNLVFRGVAKYPFMTDAKGKKKTNVDVSQVTPPIRLVVYDRVAELTPAQPQVTVKAGAETPLIVRLNRLYGYKGDFKVQVVLPQGFSSVAVPEVTVPGNANEARLVFKAPPNAKTSAGAKVKIRAVAKVSGATLTSETPLSLNVLDAKAAALPPGVKIDVVKLVPAGSAGWKHLPAAQVKGDDWTKPAFNDQAWRAAKTPLGYGEGEIANRQGTAIAEQGQPLCCRKTFDVPAPLLKQAGVTLRLNIAADNSATVYVNGVKVDEDTGDHEFSYWNRDVAVKADMLRPGTNVIAVQVHNSGGSSDLYLDVELAALAPKKEKAAK
ncbi:MAG: hypothetical protein L0Y71_17250 [Gemmataceae bacterium]|nr:hypothetical protein [Gemmataceae bacterium]